MQFDNTRVVVRERGYLELLDLALCVIREHLALLTGYALAGIVPFALLNWFLLRPYGSDLLDEFAEAPQWSYLWRVTYLTLLEMPVAAAPLTICLSKIMFQARPAPGDIARDFFKSLPQLLWIRVTAWGLVILPAVFLDAEVWAGFSVLILLVLIFLRYFLRPYSGEIILLEQTPFSTRNPLQVSTGKRVKDLHHPHIGDLLVRWMLSLVFAAPWLAAMSLAVWSVQGVLLTGKVDFTPPFYTMVYPACLWTVTAYFTVVRFLSYLDLRIRGEGWEVELRLRAAGERLTRRLA